MVREFVHGRGLASPPQSALIGPSHLRGEAPGGWPAGPAPLVELPVEETIWMLGFHYIEAFII